jgi:hypothetical protein
MTVNTNNELADVGRLGQDQSDGAQNLRGSFFLGNPLEMAAPSDKDILNVLMVRARG